MKRVLKDVTINLEDDLKSADDTVDIVYLILINLRGKWIILNGCQDKLEATNELKRLRNSDSEFDYKMKEYSRIHKY